MQTLTLKEHPEALRVIRAAAPDYRKHKAILRVSPAVALSGTYWDGGSRSTYTAVNLQTMRASAADQFDPPQFGGPATAPEVSIPEGVAIVQTGYFCGKTATAIIYINPANAAKLLPAGA